MYLTFPPNLASLGEIDKIESIDSHHACISMATEDDPFDGLLGLEDRFYDEGYRLGVADGTQAGHVEGRLFGLEKGFEKYMSMGKLHGRAIVWASRLSHPQELEEQKASPTTSVLEKGSIDCFPVPNPSDDAELGGDRRDKGFPGPERAGDTPLPVLPANSRLEKHIQTFYALVEPESLSTLNNEDAVSDFDDRLKRAQGKVKIIEKYIHKESLDTTVQGPTMKHIAKPTSSTDGNGSIEDISSLRARH